MNELYLMQHISYQLHTIVRKFSTEGILLHRYCARFNFEDEPVGSQIADFLVHMDKEQHLPIFLSVNQEYAYALVPAEDADFIIGPFRFSSYVHLKYQSNADTLGEEWLKTVPVCEMNLIVSEILLIYNLHHQQIINQNQLLLHNCINEETEAELQKHYSDLLFENHEEGITHNPYDQELREFTSIEQGNLENLKKSHEEDYTGQIGTLAKTPLRHHKNLGIVIVTLASRAAIRGGLLPEIAFSLSDSYIQKLEECHDIPAAIHLMRGAEFHYAQLVKELREQKEGSKNKDVNYHIEKCKDYIFSHLHEKIQVQDIALELGLNANYLSALFPKCEKISLTDFILKEKIKLVQNLLIYSRYTYSEIATYLGFSSQSHLGKQFKKSTGITLRQYRERYGVKEFLK
ncbi:MAG: helix-turn-helix domain-containing protein [Eubacteriales bacterium]|nr:helix-turn-helix domain-containing protein [Eubacteriales bacterium]